MCLINISPHWEFRLPFSHLRSWNSTTDNLIRSTFLDDLHQSVYFRVALSIGRLDNLSHKIVSWENWVPQDLMAIKWLYVHISWFIELHPLGFSVAISPSQSEFFVWHDSIRSLSSHGSPFIELTWHWCVTWHAMLYPLMARHLSYPNLHGICKDPLDLIIIQWEKTNFINIYLINIKKKLQFTQLFSSSLITE